MAKLYYANQNDNNYLYEYDPNTGVHTALVNNSINISVPIFVGTNGKVYYKLASTGALWAYTISTGVNAIVAFGEGVYVYPSSFVVDGNGKVWWADANDGNKLKLGFGITVTTIVAAAVSDICVDKDGNIYYTNQYLYQYDTNGQTRQCSFLATYDNIAHPDGKVYAWGNPNGRLLRYDPVTQQTNEILAAAYANSICMGWDGRVYYINTNTKVVHCYNPAAGTDTASTAATNAYELSAVPGGDIYFTDFNTKELRRFNVSDFNTVTPLAPKAFAGVSKYYLSSQAVADTTPPTAPVINVSTTNPAQSVNVTITYPADSVTRQYKIGSGVWQDYTGVFTVVVNGPVYAKCADEANNWSNEVSIDITNIDTEGPVAPVIGINPSTPTSGQVAVTITYPEDAVIKQVRVEPFDWSDYAAPFNLVDNATVHARGIDAAANIGQEAVLVVNNIDKTAPAQPSILVGNCVEGVTVVTITYAPDSATSQYKIDAGEWTAYPGPLSIYANCTISARSLDAAGNISAEAQAVVSNVVPILTEIILTPETVSLAAISDQQLSVIATKTDATTQDITSQAVYISSNENVATVLEGGVLRCLAPGSVTITVSYMAFTDTMTVEVLPAIIESVQVSPATTIIPLGRTQQLTVTGIKTDDTIQDLTATATYASSNLAVATVSAAGLVQSVARGTANITVTYSSFSVVVPLEVSGPAVDRIESVPVVQLAEGTTTYLKVTAFWSDGTQTNVSPIAAYASADPAVATVSPSGLVQGVAAGDTTITITYLGVNTAVPVSILGAAIVSIEAVPSSVNIPIGSKVSLKVVANMSNGSIIDISDQMAWSVADPEKLSIQDNYATGLFLGVTAITGTLDLRSVVITATVTEALSFFKLSFDRCQSEGISGYLVMRRGAGEQSVCIMKIVQPSKVNPVAVTGDKLRRSGGKYNASHGNILNDKPIEITVNGAVRDLADVIIDYKNGTFDIPGTQDLDMVVGGYSFDGVQALDSGLLQDGVAYYGPAPTTVSTILPPVNTAIVADPLNNRILVSFEESAELGTMYYYTFIAVDERGNRSLPSEEVKGLLKLLHPVTPYKLEKGDTASGPWTQVCLGNTSPLMESGVDSQAPDAPVAVTAGIDAGKVILGWVPPANDSYADSKFYRVKFMDIQGHESDAGDVVGPVVVTSGLDKIVVRRRLQASPTPEYPSYDGDDAVTVATLAPNVTSYTDEGVSSGQSYTYGIYVVDKAGNHSAPGQVAVQVS